MAVRTHIEGDLLALHLQCQLLAVGWPQRLAFLPHEAIVAGLLAEGFLRLAVAIAWSGRDEASDTS